MLFLIQTMRYNELFFYSVGTCLIFTKLINSTNNTNSMVHVVPSYGTLFSKCDYKLGPSGMESGEVSLLFDGREHSFRTLKHTLVLLVPH